MHLSGVERDLNREEKFLELIKADTTDLSELRKLSWSGVPPSLRADVWKLLSVSMGFGMCFRVKEGDWECFGEKVKDFKNVLGKNCFKKIL